MRLPEGAKRLAVFAYYDKDGIVDGYVPYLLKAVRRFCTRQVVMVNGALTDEARAALEQCADAVCQRPNEGFDITAYRDALLAEDLGSFDEVLFYNQTIFGPVCPLDEMFREMDGRDVDFWGLTRHKGAKAASWNDKIPIPPHVQSFFFAVRGKMLHSPEFEEYWRSLPAIHGYWEAVEKHEIRFTRHFADLGYRWDVYVRTEDLEAYNDYPLMGMPTLLLRERGCPFFKRKNFLTVRHLYTTVPQGDATRTLYEYLRDETDYPTGLIFENLLRTEPLESLVQAMGLCWVIGETPRARGRVKALLCVTSEALAPLMMRALNGLPDFVDCEVVYAGQALQEAAEPLASRPHDSSTAPGHPGQYLMSHVQEYRSGYEYLLFLSDAMPPVLEQFADATSLWAAVQSLEVEQCVAALRQDANVGLLMPLMPSHQEALTIGINLKNQSGLLQQAGLRVPMGPCGVAARGGMFFARTAALSSLAVEGSLFEGLYPAWEFVPPLLAQQNGYMTAFVSTARRMAAELLNKDSMLSEIERMWATPRKTRYDQLTFRMQAILDFYYDRRYQMTLEQAFQAPLTAKQKLWICLQILLKPSVFEKLRAVLGRRQEPRTVPEDDLD